MYEVKNKKFDNGLNLFHLQTPSDDITVIANINAGPLYENDNNNGISHFIEHMIFKGTEKSKQKIYWVRRYALYEFRLFRPV